MVAAELPEHLAQPQPIHLRRQRLERVLGLSIDDADVERLEQQLDGYNAALPPLKEFILPGGGEAAARCHVARTVVRRAERCTVALARVEDVRPQAVRYLNRLSDLLFVWARLANQRAGVPDIPWEREGRQDESART